MNWLIPAVYSTLIGTAFLFFLYLYFYIEYKSKAFFIWTISWFVYTLRFVITLIAQSAPSHHFFLTINNIITILSGYLLLAGTYYFIGKILHSFWKIMIGITIFWVITMGHYGFPFTITTLPTYLLTGSIYLFTGYIFIQSKNLPVREKIIVGTGFIIWGLHKFDYPFLRQSIWFAPFGYIISTVLEFLVALGIVILYYKTERIRFENNELNHPENPGDCFI